VIAAQREPAAAAGQCPSVVAILLDELSFSYLYDGASVRPEFPNMRAFSAVATNHLKVRAPGDETLISVPGYLAGQAFDNIRVEGDHLDYERGGTRAIFKANAPDGLFATARNAGYSPEVVGYYFPYCDILGSLVDVCRSFSFYNIATARRGVSPLHPVMTTLILWPRQFPFGLLKNPPFAALQRGLVEQTTAFALKPMQSVRPVFRFVHFSIPHLPFVFDEGGYDPPSDPLRTSPDTAYARQLRYVDALFGRLMERMREEGTYDTTSIIVLADHGFRFGGAERNPLQIPFIVKKARQKDRVDETAPMAGELLLKSVLEDACR